MSLATEAGKTNGFFFFFFLSWEGLGRERLVGRRQRKMEDRK
jgi:hypothetical protein